MSGSHPTDFGIPEDQPANPLANDAALRVLSSYRQPTEAAIRGIEYWLSNLSAQTWTAVGFDQFDYESDPDRYSALMCCVHSGRAFFQNEIEYITDLSQPWSRIEATRVGMYGRDDEIRAIDTTIGRLSPTKRAVALQQRDRSQRFRLTKRGAEDAAELAKHPERSWLILSQVFSDRLYPPSIDIRILPPESSSPVVAQAAAQATVVVNNIVPAAVGASSPPPMEAAAPTTPEAESGTGVGGHAKPEPTGVIYQRWKFEQEWAKEHPEYDIEASGAGSTTMKKAMVTAYGKKYAPGCRQGKEDAQAIINHFQKARDEAKRKGWVYPWLSTSE